MSFYKKLQNIWKKNNSLLCIGLDPDPDRLPKHLHSSSQAIFEFNKAIIDKTADLVCAYKPQNAFYAANGLEKELELTISYINTNYPEVPVILDSKRGDIGNTAKMYAKEAFERYAADAVTVNPYMGGDTLKPFLDYKDKGVVVLCKTSNPGSNEIQNLEIDGAVIYQKVAELAAKEWNANQNVLLVVGATYPEELKQVRAIAPNIPLLVPGVGAQGGSVKDVVDNALDQNKQGLIINSSRGIIFAGSESNFADKARKAAISLRDEINTARSSV